jgi:hypothetical protein
MSRFRGKIPFDPSITQKVKNALYEAGREDLLEALRDSGMAELEEECAKLKSRVIALEQEKVKWQTDSGVHRIIDARMNQKTAKAADWAVKAALKGLGAAALGWLAHAAWKGIHV